MVLNNKNRYIGNHVDKNIKYWREVSGLDGLLPIGRVHFCGSSVFIYFILFIFANLVMVLSQIFIHSNNTIRLSTDKACNREIFEHKHHYRLNSSLHIFRIIWRTWWKICRPGDGFITRCDIEECGKVVKFVQVSCHDKMWAWPGGHFLAEL